MRTLAAVLAALTLACGGDSTEPEPPFPAVAGVYNVTGRSTTCQVTHSPGH